jgi:hypothetical protein
MDGMGKRTVTVILGPQVPCMYMYQNLEEVQQFPLMPYESYTTYVGGISLSPSTLHLSLLKQTFTIEIDAILGTQQVDICVETTFRPTHGK